MVDLKGVIIMQIKILIITDELGKWLHKFNCYSKADVIQVSKQGDRLNVESEMFQMVITTKIKNSDVRGQRWNIAILDKRISKSVQFGKLPLVVGQIFYTNDYYTEHLYNRYPDKFLQYYYGINLKWYQKIWLKVCSVFDNLWC